MSSDTAEVAGTFDLNEVWRIGDNAYWFLEGDDDLMWSAKVVNGRKGQWALWIDRVLAVDDPESDDYQDFGQWRSEARAFAAVDEIGNRFERGRAVVSFHG